MSLKPRIETSIFTLISIMLFITSCLMGKGSTLPNDPVELEPTSTSAPSVIDTGLAYGIPCKPPCWQGLTPGKTTRQEAIRVMEELVANKQVDDIVEHNTGLFVYVTPNPTGAVFVRFENNILKSINGQVQFYYPVGTLVKQFGDPERLYLVGEGNSNTSQSTCAEWEPPKPLTAPIMSDPVHLLYPKLGLYFLMLQPLDGSYICPEMQVTFFCYYEPLSLSEMIHDNYLANLCGGGPDVTSEEELSKWHGFGDGY